MLEHIRINNNDNNNSYNFCKLNQMVSTYFYNKLLFIYLRNLRSLGLPHCPLGLLRLLPRSDPRLKVDVDEVPGGEILEETTPGANIGDLLLFPRLGDLDSGPGAQ